MRSLPDPPGLRYSSLARRRGATSRPIRSSRTMGVPPTSSSAVGYSRGIEAKGRSLKKSRGARDHWGMRRDALAEIEAVYRRRFPAFLRVAVAIVGDEQLARDAVQDGFVRAVRYRRRLRGAPEAWIWRIVVNEARRRRAREGRLVLVDPAELPEPSANGHAEQGEIQSL